MKDLKENEIFISIQDDGNWKGCMFRHGKLVEKREHDPQIVLQMLLTDNGN